LRALAAALSLRRLSIQGPVYGNSKVDVIRAADVSVLPTLNENFGNVVAEALAAGTLVIASKGSPWGKLPIRRLWLVD
jgi:glycosyltransferase involved in cell wall biosynthesis